MLRHKCRNRDVGQKKLKKMLFDCCFRKFPQASIPFGISTSSLKKRGNYKAQPFLFPLSGVCKNTPCFLRADCCGTLKRTVVNSFYRITSCPVTLRVALSCLVTILLWVPAASDKVRCLSLTQRALGIYAPRFIGPSELKIASMCTAPENVLSISSC